ncbi:unnamed protein product [Caenorhabditis angaria]|uniref:Uncharacterized protein n=1 Tax=Caenorhabditis angaria TaxID=860376 RepID=A0A9P1J5B9_9PELO|nr:unnamed protein product [Caenorhabditis angaria]
MRVSANPKRYMLNYDYAENQHLLYWPESVRLKVAKNEHKKIMQYTMPGVKDEFMRSPIDLRFQETFNKFFGQNDFEMNQKGLVWFIKKGMLEATLNGTTDMLTWLGQGKDKAGRPSELTQVTMELWTLRFELLINLRMHAQLLAELAAFEEMDAPDLFYQYSSTEKTGSLVPFNLRLIHAESLRFSPFPWKSLIRIEQLWTTVETIVAHFRSKNAPEKHISDWEKRLDTVKCLYVRVLYELGEYKQAMSFMENIRIGMKSVEEQVIVSRAMMRMAMQAGDEKSMNIYAEKANQYNSTANEMVLHKALRSIFLGAYSHAQDYASRLQSANYSTPQSINTRAIVQLYTGNAVSSVETISQIKPLLAGPTTTNLKTLAELCYSTAAKDELLIR